MRDEEVVSVGCKTYAIPAWCRGLMRQLQSIHQTMHLPCMMRRPQASDATPPGCHPQPHTLRLQSYSYHCYCTCHFPRPRMLPPLRAHHHSMMFASISRRVPDLASVSQMVRASLSRKMEFDVSEGVTGYLQTAKQARTCSCSSYSMAAL